MSAGGYALRQQDARALLNAVERAIAHEAVLTTMVGQTQRSIPKSFNYFFSFCILPPI
jgi:hypothetical protein